MTEPFIFGCTCPSAVHLVLDEEGTSQLVIVYDDGRKEIINMKVQAWNIVHLAPGESSSHCSYH